MLAAVWKGTKLEAEKWVRGCCIHLGEMWGWPDEGLSLRKGEKPEEEEMESMGNLPAAAQVGLYQTELQNIRSAAYQRKVELL